MSTIICNKEMMVADSFTTFGQSNARAEKMWIVGDSVFGAVGWVSDCVAAQEWTRLEHDARGVKVDKPNISRDDAFRMLKLTNIGAVLCYDERLIPLGMIAEKDLYAIGSGSGYALGAVYAGASLLRAVNIACELDIGNSGGHVDSIKWFANEKAWVHC